MKCLVTQFACNIYRATLSLPVTYIGLPSKIHQSYQDLGLQVSQSKLIPLHTQVTCLGIVVNTITRTISIPTEKLQETQNMCTQWTLKPTCTKR